MLRKTSLPISNYFDVPKIGTNATYVDAEENIVAFLIGKVDDVNDLRTLEIRNAMKPHGWTVTPQSRVGSEYLRTYFLAVHVGLENKVLAGLRI
jgi:hypothetical protein